MAENEMTIEDLAKKLEETEDRIMRALVELAEHTDDYGYARTSIERIIKEGMVG